jgi:excisionase family DNA binding protein
MSTAASKFLNVKELAQKLGVPVSTIYYWIGLNKIPCIRMYKHVRFDFDIVMAHFRNKTNEFNDACHFMQQSLKGTGSASSLKTEDENPDDSTKKEKSWQ